MSCSIGCVAAVLVMVLAAAMHVVAATPPAVKASVTIDPSRIINADFGGFGFHAFFPVHETDDEHYEQVLIRRWKVLRPSFARLTHYWSRREPGKRDSESLERLARACKRMAETGTQIYLTTWNPMVAEQGPQREAYAVAVVDDLEYLIRTAGCTNIRWYCMTNELTLTEWGSLRGDLDTFKDYHRLIYAEIQRRNLDVKLLATDASPIKLWDSIGWAAENMDDITGAYGGHNYTGGFHPGDPTLYPLLLERFSWGAGVARAKGKPFIIGEFGAAQFTGQRNGKRWDGCAYWDTPEEPLVGVQLGEAMVAALNAGVYALAYWTFTDFPADYSTRYANHWGVFQWKDHGNRIRPPYFAVGLMTRHFQRGMRVATCTSDSPLLRVAAAFDGQSKRWAIAVVNRGDQPTPVTYHFTADTPATLQKLVYDPANPPTRTDGELQDPEAECRTVGGALVDTVGPGCLVVYAAP